MAKLDKMPDQHIIDGLKKSIDFYEWMGIPVARKWPRSPGHLRAPAVMEQWAAWSYIAKAWDPLPQDIKDAYAAMVVGTKWTPRDLFTRGYLSGFYRYPRSRPDELSTLYWKDPGIRVMTDDARLVTSAWTTLDLLANTSPIAKIVIIGLHLQCKVTGTNGDNKLEVREKGGACTYNPGLFVGFRLPDWTYFRSQVMIALDASQCIEYRITVATDGNLYTKINLHAYYE